MSLKRKQGLKRRGLRAPAKPSVALEPGDRMLLDPIAEARRRDWGRSARRRPCACCGFRERNGHTYGNVEGHHVLPLRKLKNEGVPEIALYDQRIMLPLCSVPAPKRCHDRLDDGVDPLRLTREFVISKCPHALEYAREHGLVWLFDRLYPETTP